MPVEGAELSDLLKRLWILLCLDVQEQAQHQLRAQPLEDGVDSLGLCTEVQHRHESPILLPYCDDDGDDYYDDEDEDGGVFTEHKTYGELLCRVPGHIGKVVVLCRVPGHKGKVAVLCAGS